MEAIKGNLRLVIEQDDCTESPREWCNMGHMVCWHRGYTLGDEQPDEEPQEWLLEFERENPDAVMLPLFLYDHSGITMSTGAFGDIWDSGQVGYIVSKPEDWEGLKVSQVIKNLTQEVATYARYLEGDVWWFSTSRRVECSCGETEDWEDGDSCGGFYGSDWEKNGIKEYLDEEFHPLIEEL